jgi:hypothetical protein
VKSLRTTNQNIMIIKMRKLYLVSLLLVCVISCNSKPMEKNSFQESKNAEVALNFMNNYKNLCDTIHHSKSIDIWIESNNLLTDNFKSSYKETIENALKEDPELGLDFDPIFDAQYYPDKGFEILEYDEKDGYVLLRGKEIYSNFTVTVKIAKIKNKWLVDGAGIINIPKEKRRKND